MPSSVLDLCQPADSTFSNAKNDTVVNIGDLLKDTIDGDSFFNETYATEGMRQLLTQVFDRLDGRTPQGVFRLKQAMGGGKTHNLVAAGLLAKRPMLRKRVLTELDRADVSSDEMRVVVFDGKETGNKDPFWVALFRQLQPDQSKWASAVADIPGPATWAELIGPKPTLILLDELPPYLYAMSTKQAGEGTMADRVVLALANLMGAVMAGSGNGPAGRTCLVLSDLHGAWQRGSEKLNTAFDKAFDEAVRMGTAEAKRVTVDITPVRVDDSELAAILRKRVFAKYPAANDAEVRAVRDAYKKAFDTAVQQGAMTTSLRDSWLSAIPSTYPFHPGLLDLVGRFKENEGFQQTREVLRLARKLVARAWGRDPASAPLLLHPHEFDFDDPESVALLDGIHPKLPEARRRDVSNAGSATAESLSGSMQQPIYGEAARLVFFSSLATSVQAVNGLKDDEVGSYLAAPGRDVSTIGTVMQTLADHSWYLHRRTDHRWHYKDIRNVGSMIRDRANDMQDDLRMQELRTRLMELFTPQPDGGGRDAYQRLLVFPKPEEIQPDPKETVLVVCSNQDGGVPAPYLGIWNRTPWQNRVLFLTGNARFTNLKHTAAMLASAEAVRKEVKASGSEGIEVDQANVAVERWKHNFPIAVREVYSALYYPSDERLEKVTIQPETVGGKFRGDIAIRVALTPEKFADEAATKGNAFYSEFMSSRFPMKEMAWKEILEGAARDTRWYLVKPGAYETLKGTAVLKGQWRELAAEARVMKGPFPKEPTSVQVAVDRDADTGVCRLQVTAKNGDCVHYEFGSSDPTTASPLVTAGGMETSAMRVRFLAIDSTGQHAPGPIHEWRNSVTLKGDFSYEAKTYSAVLKAAPPGSAIRFTTNGANPKNGGVYDGPVAVAPGTTVLAVAESDGVWSEALTLVAPSGPETPDKGWLDLTRPATWSGFPKRMDRSATFDALARLVRHRAALHGATVRLRSTDADAERYADLRMGAKVRTTPVEIEALVAGLPEPLQQGFDVELEVKRVAFPTGAAFLEFVKELGLDPATLDRSKVQQ